jgi:hypothetical protein
METRPPSRLASPLRRPARLLRIDERASEPTPTTAATARAELARVRVPGSGRTYEVGDKLRGLGLRWDPATHARHGTIRAGDEVVLEGELPGKP